MDSPTGSERVPLVQRQDSSPLEVDNSKANMANQKETSLVAPPTTQSSSLFKTRMLPHTFFDGYGAILDVFADNETANIKTWSRIVVETYLSKFSWYFPRQTKRYTRDPPSLAKAWAYYEHISLPRRYVGEGVAEGVLHRAEPGDENETELYDPFCTPQSAFIEWGAGVDQYFMTLRFFAALLFIAGLINLVSMHYYNSENYNGPGANTTGLLLAGSAVCTNTAWVVCPDCAEEEWMTDKSRFGIASDGTILVLRNLCRGASPLNGITNFITLLFLLVSFFAFSYYLRSREIRFDEDKVTSSDYSILIQNPPKGAVEPDEWRDFFKQFTQEDQVTVVTVALNNEGLIRKLIQRRTLRRKLRLSLPEGTDIDNDEDLYEAIEPLKADDAIFGRRSPETMVHKIETLTSQIKALQDKEFQVTKVFVTFETEVAQRKALKSLTVGKLDLYRNNTSCLPQQYLFRGRVLKVKEPCEPNAVRWLDLSAGWFKLLKGGAITVCLTLIILGAVGVGITKARSSIGPGLSGPLTSLSNIMIPHVLKFMMMLETHHTEGSYQTSLYLKVTLFRWTLTAILAKIITPFTSTLSDEKTDLLPTISHILFADVYIVPIMKLLNLGDNIKKHIIGPRARTQEEMNMNFQGNHYNLGERYTDMTKVLFVVFFYSSLFPAGFFFGATILTIQYVIDKFSLMRVFGWSPLIGSELADFSRRYFFTAALITLALMSSYTWAQLPYDNICDDGDSTGGFEGKYIGVTTMRGSAVNGDGIVEVRQDAGVQYCSQSWTDSKGMALPKFRLTKLNGYWRASIEDGDFPWMTTSQAWMATLYGWIATFIVAIFASVLLYQFVYRNILSLFTNTYSPDGDCQHIDFSSDPNIFAYVPQSKINGFPFPFLACNIDKIDHALIGWGDEDRGYDDNNLIFDVPHPGFRPKHDDCDDGLEPSTMNVPHRVIYSVIKHYPTAWQHELAEQNKFQLGRKNL